MPGLHVTLWRQSWRSMPSWWMRSPERYNAKTGSLAAAIGALHAWTTGAMGTMTLAVMTRATLGHTGRDVVSTPGNIAIYAAILAAAVARIAAPLLPAIYLPMLWLAAAAWLLAFGIFVLAYGPMLLRAPQSG